MAFIIHDRNNLKFENCSEIEMAVARWFNPRQNLAVPNVSWGLVNHECDLLIMTKSNYLYEVEIKISKSDLMKDRHKKHSHDDKRIKYLYFAIPEKMIKDIEHIPDRAGILVVDRRGACHLRRSPVENPGSRRLEEKEIIQFYRLGALRLWPLKSKAYSLKRELKLHEK